MLHCAQVRLGRSEGDGPRQVEDNKTSINRKCDAVLSCSDHFTLQPHLQRPRQPGEWRHGGGQGNREQESGGGARNESQLNLFARPLSRRESSIHCSSRVLFMHRKNFFIVKYFQATWNASMLQSEDLMKAAIAMMQKEKATFT